MERKIGEIFEYNGAWYQCVKDDYPFNCNECCFYNRGDKKCSEELTGYCSSGYRSDGKEIIFKKLEKVGEPYEFDGHLFQSYRTFEVPIFTENYATVRELGNNSKISIEIKQTKEDMEEKKQKLDDLVGLYTSAKITYKEFDEKLKTLYADKEECKSILKEFDLEAAKAGKPVCTRDGRKARIICFDAKSEQPIIALVSEQPIIALVEDNHFGEIITQHHENGAISESETRTSNSDLMMLPEKKEGWVNVYKGGLLDTKSYNTKKEAFDKASPKDYIYTVKIEWYE